MEKKSFKEFVKEHKMEIVIGGSIICAGVLGVLVGATVPRKSKLSAEWEKFAEILGSAAEGATAYVGGNDPDEMAKVLAVDIITCGPDCEKLKPTGMIVFGNRVDP